MKDKHPAIDFKTVAADLSAKTSVAAFDELIEESLENLDIGIVCLNAGAWIEGPADLISDANFERVINLNGLQKVYFTKALLPKLLSRDRRSALMATSSILARTSIPGLASYSATKAMTSNFMEALNYELRHKIDVTVWEPGPC